MIKRIILLLTMILPIAVYAFEGESVIDGMNYYINTEKQTATVTRMFDYQTGTHTSTYAGDIVIPSTIKYDGIVCNVESIGSDAFLSCSELTSITLPTSINKIGSGAFCYCTGLTSITIPYSIKEIGNHAFCYCNLETITVDSKNMQYDSRNNSNAIIETSTNTLIAGCKNSVIPDDITTIGLQAFMGCSNLTSIEIPNSVTDIGHEAFFECSDLKSITIPNSVLYIEEAAFFKCSNLTSLFIPASVEAFGPAVFSFCSGLESITVDSKNTHFDSRDNCNAIIETSRNMIIAGCKNTTIPSSIDIIGSLSFYGCRDLTSITIPDNVTLIADQAFFYCQNLTSVTMSNNIEYIHSHAFRDCNKLTSITIPNTIKEIGSSAFAGCSGLTSLNIPNSITYIGDYAISGCSSLKNFIIPTGITSIESGTFSGCSSLTSITIPANIKSIGDFVFQNCTSLTTIECLADNVPKASDMAFFGLDFNIATLYVPEKTINAYKNTNPWYWFSRIEPLNASDINDINTSTLFAQAKNGQIIIEGINKGAEVSVYTINGSQITKVVSNGKPIIIPTQLPSGSTAIVKIGKNSIKVVM